MRGLALRIAAHFAATPQSPPWGVEDLKAARMPKPAASFLLCYRSLRVEFEKAMAT